MFYNSPPREARKIAEKQFAQKTAFKDKFEVVWNFISPYIKENRVKLEKSVGQSMLWREVGNREYTTATNRNYLRKSIEAYTKSIAFAPVGSKELSLAYANRSAVLFRARLYEDCLLDIERSLKLGYPNKLKTKLFLRQSLCFKALKPNSKLETDISMANAMQWLPDLKKYNPKYNITKEYPKMIKELKEPREIIEFIPEINDNAIIVGASDAIELKKTNKNDQHIVATRDIKSGEFIYISEPFAATISNELRSTNCWHCCRSTWAGVPCDNCPNAIYCSDICKKKAWDSYHNIECLVLGELLQHALLTTEYSLTVKLFLKTLNLAGSLVELKKKVDTIDSMKNQGPIFTNGILDVNTIDNFHLLNYLKPTSNEYDFEILFFGVLMVQLFGEKTDILGHKMTIKDLIKNEKSSILGELILRYLLTVLRNSQLLTEPGLTALLSHVISPVWKILKPSCDPNVDWTHVGSNVGYYAIKPIKQGEPVLLGALGLYHMIPKTNRFLPLGNTDLISCKCKACVENWPTFNDLPSYQNIILPTRSKEELNCIVPTCADWQERVHHGDTKELLIMKDTINSLNDKLHQYNIVPCKEISALYILLRTLYNRLHTVHDFYE